MATKPPGYAWDNGFRELSSEKLGWGSRRDDEASADDDYDVYVQPPKAEIVSSTCHNEIGVNVVLHWPTIYDGTNSPHGVPPWWKPEREVDVLICGAGPSGLEMAVGLARQGVTFRIIDAAERPLVVGRADGVQPRFLETASQWGLSTEIHEEGPIIERTAIYKDGQKLLFNRSHQSDSRYRGLHVITQAQIERVLIRDLLRHRILVERSSVVDRFHIEEEYSDQYSSRPVHAVVRNTRTGDEELIQAKFLVGSDGASSATRKKLAIPFDGVSTDIYWGIMDCIFQSDYPHAWVFGSVISSRHGGCVIIPREDGYIRLYTQLDLSQVGTIATSRQAADATFTESGGKVEAHSITPEEVLEQANRIFAPYKIRFAAPLSWFAVWKISERVARSYSSPDMRVHLVGDAAHVHSVMGAFGLNASILDAANLSWKLGLVAKGHAKLIPLLATYSSERRKHAIRVIETSGTYLRFVCGSDLAVPNLRDVTLLEERRKRDAEARNDADEAEPEEKPSPYETKTSKTNGETEKGKVDDLEFLADFFKQNGQFLLGVDCPYDASVIAPEVPLDHYKRRPIRVKNGVRAPNPRLCFSSNTTGYLYDKLAGPARFHLLLFGSSLEGAEVCRQVCLFLKYLSAPGCFYRRFGASARFNLVMIVKMLPFEWEDATGRRREIKSHLPVDSTVIFDDRAPGEDGHSTWGVDHHTGGVAVVRPDLWVSLSAMPCEVDRVSSFFEAFLM